MKLSRKTITNLFIGLIITGTIFYASCKQSINDSPNERSSSNSGESLNVVDEYVVLGCYNELTGNGVLKYSTSVINEVVSQLLNDGSIITNSTLVKAYDSISEADVFYIKSNFTNGATTIGQVAITLNIVGDDLTASVNNSCTHSCIATGDCVCNIWNLSPCLGHNCLRDCGTNQLGGCSSTITSGGITISNPTVTYLNQQTPLCN